MKNNTIKLNICISDIPKAKIKKGKNGKKYVDVIMFQRNEADEFGNDYCLTISKTKDEIKADVKTVYVGNAKTFAQKEAI